MVGARAARRRPSRIVRDPQVLGGEPSVAGTRVPVRSIAVGVMRYGGDLARVAHAYRLHVEDVEQALAYYEAHREEIDALIRANEVIVESTEG